MLGQKQLKIEFRKIKKTLQVQKGATMVEYAIMVALVAIVAIGAVAVLGQKTNQLYNNAVQAYPGSG